jgi:hypothetical protein
MDVNKEIATAAAFAQAVWIAAGIVLYVMTPGASLISSSSAVFFVAGMFAVAPIFGLIFYGVRRGFANASAAWLLPAAEAIMIFVAADWAFQRLETFSAGVPVEYVSERDSFDGSLKSFSAANTLEEEAKTGREQGKVDPDIEARVVAFMEDGIARSRNVGDPFLTYLDPELPEPYRTQLVKGYEMLVEGRRTGDVAMQTMGNELVRQFYEEFLPSRADAILAKLGLRAQ